MNRGLLTRICLQEPPQIVAIPSIDSKQRMGKLKNRGFSTPSHQVGFKTKSWYVMVITTGWFASPPAREVLLPRMVLPVPFLPVAYLIWLLEILPETSQISRDIHRYSILGKKDESADNQHESIKPYQATIHKSLSLRVLSFLQWTAPSRTAFSLCLTLPKIFKMLLICGTNVMSCYVKLCHGGELQQGQKTWSKHVEFHHLDFWHWLQTMFRMGKGTKNQLEPAGSIGPCTVIFHVTNWAIKHVPFPSY